RFQQARFSVEAARGRAEELKKPFEDLVHCHDDGTMMVFQDRVREVLDKLRSALDYCAHELFERCNGGPPAEGDKVYFPIARKGANPADFKSLVGSNIRNLHRTRPDLVELLASFQEFTSPDNGWLPDLATFPNANKLGGFTGKIRVESRGLVFRNVILEGPGARSEVAQLVLEGSAPLRLGSGFELRADRVSIPGPRVIRGEPPHLEPP